MFLINIKHTYILLWYSQHEERSHKVRRKGRKFKRDEEKLRDVDKEYGKRTS